ncbi:MAG: hypothetical protein WDA01_11795 [Methanothrix sp.]
MFNTHELQFDLGNGKKMMVFKHVVGSTEYVKGPREEKARYNFVVELITKAPRSPRLCDSPRTCRRTVCFDEIGN